MQNSNKDRRATYSVAIRTIGRAGKKYQMLLNSINRLCYKPEKVVVVLPKGYQPPREQLGMETFIFCEKSMIQQRIEALKVIDSEYTLFLDDDIEFSPNFVDKLMAALEDEQYDCATGPLFSFFPSSLAGKVAGTLIGNVAFRFWNRGYYVRILRNGGWSYRYVNTNVHRIYPTQSFAWTCFMIRTNVMRDIHMEDEISWLERNGYAWGDDRVMAYKMLLLGYKACVVSDALYTHNDAQTSTKGEMDQSKKVYCSSFFSRVFWQRFIQNPERSLFYRVINFICFYYSCVMEKIYYAAKYTISFGETHIVYISWKNGQRDAKHYIQYGEYSSLPPIL